MVGALLAPHPRGPQPSALGDFSVPTAEEGRAITVVIGTCIIKGSNTTWWGDLKSKAIKVGGGILSLGRTQTTGYQYFLGVQSMLCHGPVDLVDIQTDDKSIQPRTTATILNGSGTEDYIQVTCNAPKLFGGTGPGGGGGITGIIDFYRGLPTSQPNAYLGAKQGRIATDQSGIGSTFFGVGNGGITSLAAGSSSLEEIFTITFVAIDTNNLHSTFGKAKWSIVGSVSGGLSNAVANAEGSHDLWSDQAFSNPRINLTIHTGSTQYGPGDVFTIKTLHSHVAPSYRNLCYAVMEQLYWGTSNYLKPMAFVVRRCPDPLSQGAGVANISGDANGALAIYDILSNVDYGLGIPTARIDPVSFSAAAVTLSSEGLGISMQFDTQASADQLIGEVLRHVDGVLYTDPQTGLWSITLARGGYDPTTLPTLTVDSVLETPDFSRGSWRETTNLVNIRYSSRAANFADRSIRAYDPANIAVTNEVRPQTIDFKGLSNATSSALVAMRVLKTLTYPLSKLKLKANRSAWQFRPGGVFRFTWVPLGIINEVFRITRIGYGELTDGKISIDAVEDIFGINSVAFVSPPSSGWVNPIGTPLANTYEQLVEVPNHLLALSGLSGRNVMSMAAKNPLTGATGYAIWRDDGTGYFDTNLFGNFCPVGILSADYPVATLANDPTGFTLSASGGIDLILLAACTAADFLQGVNLCMIDGEIMAWQTPTLNADGTYTISPVLRGLMDTVPALHTAGAKVWFFSIGSGLLNSGSFPSDRTINAKLLPTNSSGTLPIGSATAESVTTNSRVGRPYPPGNLRMQGLPYGSRYKTITGNLVLTFSARNRDTEAGLTPLTLQTAGDDSIPFSEAFLFTIYRFVGGFAPPGNQSTTVPPGASFTYTAAQRIVDSGLPGIATVKIFGAQNLPGPPPVLLESLQWQQVDVTFTGFGILFGQYFGGLNS